MPQTPHDSPHHTLILIMVDGVSADYMAKHVQYTSRLPFLSRLASQGCSVTRLSAIPPALSLAGRSTIVTGVACDQHGVYGNTIWDGDGFRYATPDDVRAPTIAKQAHDAGLNVAVMGYGMIRPEDTTTFHHAWWTGEMIQRGRDDQPLPAHEGWLRTLRHTPQVEGLKALYARGYPEGVPDPYVGGALEYFAAELVGDQTMMAYTSGLATSDNPPHLILTEILLPDSVQHQAGYESLHAHWSINYADALIGQLIEHLRQADRIDNCTLAIMSDHGHGPVSQAFHPEVLLPDVPLACEGGFLHVYAPNAQERTRITAVLAPHNITVTDASYIPKEQREDIMVFKAPLGYSFERLGPEQEPTVQSPPRYISSHGLGFDSPSDDRFCIFVGPHVPNRTIPWAHACQVAPTLAALLGLPLTPYSYSPIFV